jgi:hypothetical protein
MTGEKSTEPPSWLRPPVFMIGQDDCGRWVVQDQAGLRGGLFVNREAALRYVRAENGYRAQAVVMISGAFDLDISGGLGLPQWQNWAGQQPARRVA